MPVYLGIDVAKAHLDLSYLEQAAQIANTPAAISRWLKKLPPSVILVCEASGGYENTLLALAHAAARPIRAPQCPPGARLCARPGPPGQG